VPAETEKQANQQNIIDAEMENPDDHVSEGGTPSGSSGHAATADGQTRNPLTEGNKRQRLDDESSYSARLTRDGIKFNILEFLGVSQESKIYFAEAEANKVLQEEPVDRTIHLPKEFGVDYPDAFKTIKALAEKLKLNIIEIDGGEKKLRFLVTEENHAYQGEGTAGCAAFKDFRSAMDGLKKYTTPRSGDTVTMQAMHYSMAKYIQTKCFSSAKADFHPFSASAEGKSENILLGLCPSSTAAADQIYTMFSKCYTAFVEHLYETDDKAKFGEIARALRRNANSFLIACLPYAPPLTEKELTKRRLRPGWKEPSPDEPRKKDWPSTMKRPPATGREKARLGQLSKEIHDVSQHLRRLDIGDLNYRADIFRKVLQMLRETTAEINKDLKFRRNAIFSSAINDRKELSDKKVSAQEFSIAENKLLSTFNPLPLIDKDFRDYFSRKVQEITADISIVPYFHKKGSTVR
jgi:hypothetical protein